MKIAFVIGHDSGAKGAYGNMGISEYDFNTRFVYELVKRLKSENFGKQYQTFYRNANISGYTNQMKDLHKRIDMWGSDISIEFHFNSFSNETVNGHEVLYCSDKGFELAVQLDELFDAYLDNKDRGVKRVTLQDNGGGFCCRGRSICLLVEPFFASHQNRFIDCAEMREPLKNAYVDFIAGL